jgi:hypothetical protein
MGADMIIKGLQDEVFNDYKKPAMQIVFPHCSFKCDKENGCKLCQNSALAQHNPIYYDIYALIRRYLNNPITKAVVCGGLEPMDSPNDLLEFITALRKKSEDDIVIYTGYTEDEVKEKGLYKDLSQFTNIIIKFGRFRPGQEPHFDEILGVNLASDNQYAKKVGKDNEL